MKVFDATGAFLPPTTGDGFRRLAIRGAGVTMLAQGAAFAVQMVATVVLARLLMPSDFGVVTMVTTFSVLLLSCGQIGFPDAVLQRDEMNHFLASNLFWLNLGIGLVLTIGFATTGSLLARFYGDPRVAGVAAGLSLTIFLTSASVLHLALLRRAMRFSAVLANDILARAVSVTASVLLARGGWGYWALVAGAVAQPLAMSIGLWGLCRWIPSLPRRASGTASMIRFARNVFGHYCVSYFTQNTDNLLVGWRFGSGVLGFYKRAYDLFILPLSLLNIFPVALSTLSRLNRNLVQYREHFLGGLSILAFVGMGLGAEFTLVGGDLVRLVLGPQWEMAGRIFTFFGPGIGAMLVYSTHGMIHLSIGTTRRYFYWGIVEFTVTLLLFLLGLRWGPVFIALAWTASYWLLMIPSLWYAGRPIKFGVAPMFAVIWRYALASLLAGCICAGIIRELPSSFAASGAVGAFYRIITTSLLLGVLYLCAVVLLHNGCEPLYRFTRVLRELTPWNKCGRPSEAAEANYGSGTSTVLIPTTTEETI